MVSSFGREFDSPQVHIVNTNKACILICKPYLHEILFVKFRFGVSRNVFFIYVYDIIINPPIAL